ncbi:LSU methyltransferase RlmI [Clostridiaceae bacterium JG1575]|nr:LSU methyltransferase RlmI [Clostridiaceae bacterium JG1575]
MNSSCTVYLKHGNHAVQKGHPWVYTDEIDSFQGHYENGDVVSVFTAKGQAVGQAFINDQSRIALRLLTRELTETVDEAFFARRLRLAAAYRADVMAGESSYRLVHGESDGLPGLTVDRYGPYFVLQSLCLGMDRWKKTIVDLLIRDHGALGVLERSDVRVRALEGMAQTKGFLSDPFDPLVEIEENGVRYQCDLLEGQKTGFFLDQKENRRAIHRIVRGKRVLDCFTHTGSFALNAAKAGAASVLGIDVSASAVALAQKNAALNGLSDTARFETHNAFDALTQWAKEGQTYEVVILDPPAFTKSRAATSGAVRGYRDINLRGLRLLAPGGYLVTCSCSHFMKEELFRKTILEAAQGANRLLRQVEFRTQSPDHPILMMAPETYYLKFFIFQVL